MIIYEGVGPAVEEWDGTGFTPDWPTLSRYYEQRMGTLIGWAFVIVKDRDLAVECVQEAFIKMHRSYGERRVEGFSLHKTMLVVLKSVCFDALRTQTTRARVYARHRARRGPHAWGVDGYEQNARHLPDEWVERKEAAREARDLAVAFLTQARTQSGAASDADMDVLRVYCAVSSKDESRKCAETARLTGRTVSGVKTSLFRARAELRRQGVDRLIEQARLYE